MSLIFVAHTNVFLYGHRYKCLHKNRDKRDRHPYIYINVPVPVPMHKSVWVLGTTNRGTRGLKVPLVPISYLWSLNQDHAATKGVKKMINERDVYFDKSGKLFFPVGFDIKEKEW